jgi:hypothetical protein
MNSFIELLIIIGQSIWERLCGNPKETFLLYSNLKVIMFRFSLSVLGSIEKRDLARKCYYMFLSKWKRDTELFANKANKFGAVCR